MGYVMTYLNCPFCPAQSLVMSKIFEITDHLGNPNIWVKKASCKICNKEFFVRDKYLTGKKENDADSESEVLRRCVE